MYTDLSVETDPAFLSAFEDGLLEGSALIDSSGSTISSNGSVVDSLSDGSALDDSLSDGSALGDSLSDGSALDDSLSDGSALGDSPEVASVGSSCTAESVSDIVEVLMFSSSTPAALTADPAPTPEEAMSRAARATPTTPCDMK
jgi:hypothetical protein